MCDEVYSGPQMNQPQTFWKPSNQRSKGAGNRIRVSGKALSRNAPLNRSASREIPGGRTDGVREWLEKLLPEIANELALWRDSDEKSLLCICTVGCFLVLRLW
jgi:hypothetical protein